jgi:hypothetical protein
MTDPRRQASPRDSGGSVPRGMAYPQAGPGAGATPPLERGSGGPPNGGPPNVRQPGDAPTNNSGGPTGPHIGPIPITATGVLILVALIGSVLYLVYALSVRDASQIPLLASGAVVLGLVFVAIAAVGARATWRSSVDGHDARAFGHAIVGGVAALIAAACFSGAIILILLRQTPSA